MEELLRTNDAVLISFVEALLRERRIESFVFDAHTSLLEGSINALQKRVMVASRNAAAARGLLVDAGVELGSRI